MRSARRWSSRSGTTGRWANAHQATHQRSYRPRRGSPAIPRPLCALRVLKEHEIVALAWWMAAVLILSFPSVVAAQDTATQGTAQQPAFVPPIWLQAVGGVAGTVAAVMGIWTAFLTSQKSRLEMRKLQLELLEKQGKLQPGERNYVRVSDIVSSPQLLTLVVQDFIIRFLIIYIVRFGLSIFESLFVNPIRLLSQAILSVLDVPFLYSSPIFNMFFSVILSIGDLIIFAALAWPLLVDIGRTFGLPLRIPFVPRRSGLLAQPSGPPSGPASTAPGRGVEEDRRESQ
jgi:hypothetical protein